MLAGSLCVDETFRQVDPDIRVEWLADDGDRATAGQTLATVTGSLPNVLTAERTALNFLGLLSGVATATRRFVDAVEGAGDARLKAWDTRKHHAGLRVLEKAAEAPAVRRTTGNLSDWVLLKDNHLTILGIDDAVARARALWPDGWPTSSATRSTRWSPFSTRAPTPCSSTT